MASVVITGSTRGIGRGLAEQFVRRGHQVVISSRRAAEVDKAVKSLNTIGPGTASGQVCDMTSKVDVQSLWDHGWSQFGKIDYWINNAGRAISRYPAHELPEDLIHTLVDGNLKGTIFGSQIAICGFRKQGSGVLYNMLGGTISGSRRLTPSMSVYSATKAAVWLFTRYLIAENTNPKILIGTISPGMLITENWFAEQKEMSAEAWREIRPILNILCDDVGTATPWLVEQMLSNQKSGKRIAWMTTSRLLRRFIGAKVFRRERDLFSRYGL